MKWLTCFSVLIILCLSSCGIDQPDASSVVTELNASIPGVVRDGLAPSMQVSVFSDDSIIWSRTFGDGVSMRHVYMIASVQKVVTAVAVMKLSESGKLDLDDDVCHYLPFELRHPDYPDVPITVRMLLAHRSGLGEARCQFGWDTRAIFSPEYRPSPPRSILAMTLEEFMTASLVPKGENYTDNIWRSRPGTHYYYSTTAFPLLNFIVERVTEQSYESYVQEHIFTPLGMGSSGFLLEEFPGRHAIPYTRIDGRNILLPLWEGQGRLMRCTADDLSYFFLALQNNGRHNGVQLLSAESVRLMSEAVTDFKVLFRPCEEMQRSGHGLGLHPFRGGWYGYGGSAPGFQCLARYNPSRRTGYVILCNVNAILGGGENYASARKDIYEVQAAVLDILDPWYPMRSRLTELVIILAVTTIVFVLLQHRRRRARRRTV